MSDNKDKFIENIREANEILFYKLMEQTEDLEALRGFAEDFFEYYRERDKSEIFTSLALQHGLINENGNPTKLLTGEE